MGTVYRVNTDTSARHCAQDHVCITHLFLTIPEVGKSKIKVPVDSVSGENSLPDLPIATYFLYPHMAEREKKKKKTCLYFLSLWEH